ncbi:hypothetical protein UlMin_042407 [Ulmus minor]
MNIIFLLLLIRKIHLLLSAGQVSKLIADLHKTFALRDLGVLSYFLDVKATYSNDAIHLSQSKYIADLLAKIDMSDCKPAKTPSTIGKSISQYDGEPFEDVTLYRSVVGALQYACQFMHHLTTSHWMAVKRILRYLRGTMQERLLLTASDSFQIQAYIDADWVGSLDDRRSANAYCIFLGNTLVLWSATKHNVVS